MANGRVIYACPDGCGTDLDDDGWCPTCETLFSAARLQADNPPED